MNYHKRTKDFCHNFSYWYLTYFICSKTCLWKPLKIDCQAICMSNEVPFMKGQSDRGPGHSQLIKINGQGIQYTRVHNHCHIRFNLSLILNQSWLNFTSCRYIKSCVLFAVSIFCYWNIFLCIWEILSEVIRVGYDSIIKCLQKSPVSPRDEPTMTNKSIQYILLFLRWSVNKHHSNFYWILVADSDKFLAFPAANQIRRYFYFGRISGWGIF